jgi:hypothetical protein
VANPGVSSEWWQESTVKDETPDALPMRLWGPLALRVNASVVAQNAIVLAYTDDDGTTWKVGGLDKASGTVSWSVPLPMEPAFSGVSIASNGTILVALRDGRVVGVGSGPVSVASEQPTAPAVPVASAAQATATGWDAELVIGARTVGASTPTAAPVRVDAATTEQITRTAIAALQPWERDLAVEEELVAAVNEPQLQEPNPEPQYQRRDMQWRPDSRCLPMVGVSSSFGKQDRGISLTTDADLRTRWTPAGQGRTWVLYDLGTQSTVAEASLVWYARRRASIPVQIEVSVDGSTFLPAGTALLEGRGTTTQTVSLKQTRGRFVRLSMDTNDSGSRFSVYEFGLHATPSVRWTHSN